MQLCLCVCVCVLVLIIAEPACVLESRLLYLHVWSKHLSSAASGSCKARKKKKEERKANQQTDRERGGEREREERDVVQTFKPLPLKRFLIAFASGRKTCRRCCTHTGRHFAFFRRRAFSHNSSCCTGAHETQTKVPSFKDDESLSIVFLYLFIYLYMCVSMLCLCVFFSNKTLLAKVAQSIFCCVCVCLWGAGGDLLGGTKSEKRGGVEECG